LKHLEFLKGTNVHQLVCYMGQKCTVGQGARPSVEDMSMPKERISSRLIKGQNLPEMKNFSRSQITAKSARPALADVPTNDLSMNVSKSLCPSSLSLMPRYSEQSMTNFDWSTGNGLDGLRISQVKTREQVGMEALKAMEACGANVKDLSTHGGRSALMFAVLSKDLNFVKRLVEDGANVLEENEQGETALALAKSLPSQEIYAFLLKASDR